jgi:Family of unknown function (DUF6445)
LDITLLGNEMSPIVTIDDLVSNPAMLVKYACDVAQFSSVESNLYPGVRAPMPLNYVSGAVRALDPLIRTTFGIPQAVLANAECFFSIVTTPPEDLRPLQKVPHIDTNSALHFAVVHFLCNGPFGGTAFYRQNATGFENITPSREREWARHRDHAISTIPDDAGYIDDGSGEYQRIGFVSAKFNRLILYRSHLLHSGLIPPGMPMSDDPATGRLTANFFIGYRAQ